ncbi:MAG: SpoIVB peptidase S55 domain-containing protein [Candidatus Scalinduaceae bacterium]
MEIIKKIALLFIFKLLVSFCVVAIPTQNNVLAIELMNVDEITPGMKGYGKTVFSGQRIEVFNIEVLGVLKNWEARSDMILIKMTGGPLNKTGIVAGMSGSPVYIDNKLVGAVSHGWSFSKEAIAGVTPIGVMLDVLKIEPQTEKSAFTKEDSAWSTPLNTQDVEVVNKLLSHGISFEDKLSANSNFQQPFTIDLVPIQTPLITSGFDNRSLKRMNSLFNKRGWLPFQSNKGSTNSPNYSHNLVPGAAIAVEMVRGDLSVCAIGTITYKEGNDILAFGHPLIQSGTTDLPMSTAHIYTILASQSGSVKMAVPGEVIGRITQDRRSSISGRLGEYAQMIPCQVEIKGSLNTKYNFEIVHDNLLTPNLIQMTVESSLLATEKSIGEKFVNLRLDIEIDGRHKPITMENIYYDPGPSWFSIYKIVHPIATLLNNKFMDVKIKSIKLVANITETKNIASIESIWVSKKWVTPGDEIYLKVKLKPFAQECVSIPLEIKIPDDVTRGSTIRITVCDANHSEMLKRTSAPGRLMPTSFEQLVSNLEDVENNKNLITRIQLSRRGLTYMGESFPSLPNSYLSIMSLSNRSGIGRLRGEMIKRIPTNWLITGKQSVNLFVENNN